MSLLLSTTIASLCAGAIHQEACSKAIEASARQVGAYEQIEMVENSTENLAKNKLTKALGPTGESVVIASVSALKLSSGKEVHFTMGGGPISDKIGVGGSKRGGKLNLEWSW